MSTPVTSAEVCAAAGITYRQLDYWVRRGWIQCSQVTSSLTGNSGSGCERRWSEQQAAKVMHMAGLVREGYRTDRAAELIAGWFADERTPAGTGWPQ